LALPGRQARKVRRATRVTKEIPARLAHRVQRVTKAIRAIPVRPARQAHKVLPVPVGLRAAFSSWQTDQRHRRVSPKSELKNTSCIIQTAMCVGMSTRRCDIKSKGLGRFE